MLLALRDALADGDRVVTVTLPSGLKRPRGPARSSANWVRPSTAAATSPSPTKTITPSGDSSRSATSEGFIYRGHDVMPWCGRCGTGLSQMEVAEGRRITTHTSVFVRFPVSGQEKTALLVWTTTPWTLTSNVAVAVNPEMTYLKVRHGDWIYYVAKAQLRARPRAGSASGRQARDSQTALDPHHPERQRRRGSARRISGTRVCSGSPIPARSTICPRRTRPAAYSLMARPEAGRPRPSRIA